MKTLAIIGSTASGKSDLALALAQKHNASILSIDSLSIYRHIDIASAKPSKEELALVPHFGIDRLEPDVNASVFTFIDEYHRAVESCMAEGKNLIIVGGSSFYLKSMLEGLSPIPEFSHRTIEAVAELIKDLEQAHALLTEADPSHMAKIQPSDAYRIEKLALIYLETGFPPSQWFQEHPAVPVIPECPVFDLKIDRELLRERIALRTRKMVESGLIDEVAELERLYGRSPNSMKAIGIIETLEFLDGKLTRNELIDAVSTHTAQLAKRQQTFNAHQFTLSESGGAEQIMRAAETFLKQP
jgi:tRNA dimethylallyltransferase